MHSVGAASNKLHKEAFSAGFKRVFGVDTHIDVIKHHGGTDPLIALKVMEHHGIPKQQARPGPRGPASPPPHPVAPLPPPSHQKEIVQPSAVHAAISQTTFCLQ